MTIRSFLGQQRQSEKPQAMKSGDSKLEREWELVDYRSIDEMSLVGLTLLAKPNRIICVTKYISLRVPLGGVNVFLVTISNIAPCMMPHCTPIFHYPPKTNSTTCCPFPNSSNQLRHQTFSTYTNGKPRGPVAT